MGAMIIIFFVLVMYVGGLWLSIAAFRLNKYIGYLTTFHPIIIGFMFLEPSLFYITPVLLISLAVYHIVDRKRSNS